MNRFKQKTAIITGSGTGIGLAIAEALGKEGCNVVINDVSEKVANKASEYLKGLNINCAKVIGDSGDMRTIKLLIETAIDKFGQLDLCIANAGITTFGDFLTYAEQDFDKLMHVNLKGTYFLAQQSALQMIKQNTKGSILLMSSVTGHQYHPQLTAYGMTKAGIGFLAKSLGVELAPNGITVNAISPGATLTERTLELSDNFSQTWDKITPTRKAATTSDIANAALFLLDPKSSQITAQTLIVDGGWTAYSPPPED